VGARQQKGIIARMGTQITNYPMQTILLFRYVTITTETASWQPINATK
jgi:hypothetical protein